ncbi:MAG: TolC family protein, partial [Planctomycetota bacterium]
MARRPSSPWKLASTCWLLVVLAGCQLRDKPEFEATCSDACFTAVATEITYPDAKERCSDGPEWAATPPLTLANADEMEYWDLTLEAAIQIALSRSQVIRDLGGAVVRSAPTIPTQWDPALVETDPRFGVDAALSAFDAQFSSSVFGEKNDKAVNNEFFGGGTRLLQQDLAVMQAQIAKRAATGTEFSFRHNVDYDSNNAPGNRFMSAWNVNLETEVRHPLLQGGGVQFNRIAGPNDTPGLYNGVLIARVNTDIELTDFEAAVRDLVSNLENAYWDLYFSYRDLDAKVAARDTSLETWRKIHALYKA